MAKAQITLPGGAKVTLDGTPIEIAETLARLQTGGTSKIAKARAARPGRMGLTDLITNLIDGGFFKKPKDLASVKQALEEIGHHYPVTTLSGTMLGQVRKRNLRRLKQDKRWMYTG